MNQAEVVNSITIDGDAGAGKSTLGEKIAKDLRFLYFDTGIMYRVLTAAALRQGADVSNASLMGKIAESMNLKILAPTVQDGRQNTILLDDYDVTWDLRTPDVDRNVSQAASHLPVRSILRERQRQIGLPGEVVMVGRDIGNIVLPEARLKIYMQASAQVRAHRRWKENKARGVELDLAQIEADIIRRDQLDAHVMVPAPDAIFLDSGVQSIEQEIDTVMMHWAQRVSPQVLRRIG